MSMRPAETLQLGESKASTYMPTWRFLPKRPGATWHISTLLPAVLHWHHDLCLIVLSCKEQATLREREEKENLQRELLELKHQKEATEQVRQCETLANNVSACELTYGAWLDAHSDYWSYLHRCAPSRCTQNKFKCWSTQSQKSNKRKW